MNSENNVSNLKAWIVRRYKKEGSVMNVLEKDTYTDPQINYDSWDGIPNNLLFEGSYWVYNDNDDNIESTIISSSFEGASNVFLSMYPDAVYNAGKYYSIKKI